MTYSEKHPETPTSKSERRDGHSDWYKFRQLFWTEVILSLKIVGSGRDQEGSDRVTAEDVLWTD